MKKTILLFALVLAAFSSCVSKAAIVANLPEEFDELAQTFAVAKPLIEDEADRQKLSAAVEAILLLSQAQGSKTEYGTVYDDGSRKLSVRHSGGGVFKGAFGHRVKAVFYFRDGVSYINFFLTDDDTDLFIDIGWGGHKGDDWDEQLPHYDYEPNRFYEFNTRTGSVRTGDFYWD